MYNNSDQLTVKPAKKEILLRKKEEGRFRLCARARERIEMRARAYLLLLPLLPVNTYVCSGRKMRR